MATLYAHLSRVAVGAGDNVAKGDVIAYEGTTGFSTGPHLHFEVRVNGKPNNPMAYVR
jgi:murein DD-endopeptidase MepM/ murein hydrolase activator NlpD